MTKSPRSSLTSSWTIFGIWKSITRVATDVVLSPSGPGVPGLLRVELDDELLLDRRVDLRTVRQLQNFAAEVVVVGLEPRGDRGGEVGRVAHDLLGRRVRCDRDHAVGPHLAARDVHAAAVHVEVTVANELPGLRARGGEAEAVDDVVEPRLEHLEQVLARDARPLRGLRVVAAELLL